jgi:hypothetical protein
MLVGDSQGRFQEALLLRPAMENPAGAGGGRS